MTAGVQQGQGQGRPAVGDQRGAEGGTQGRGGVRAAETVR